MIPKISKEIVDNVCRASCRNPLYVDEKLQEMENAGQKILATAITDTAFIVAEALRELYDEQIQGGAQRDAEQDFKINYELEPQAIQELAISLVQSQLYNNMTYIAVAIYESIKQQEITNELNEQFELPTYEK